VYEQRSFDLLVAMSKSVDDIFESGKYTDYVVSTKGHEFKCHRVMLMEKSPVLESMVSNY
jgi:hypothetical protein